MRWRISQWKPRHLLSAWGLYWLGLIAVTLGRGLAAIRQATSGPPNSSSVSLSFDNSMLALKVQEHGQTVWAGSASFLAITLWFAVPPLLLWLFWLQTRRRHPQLQNTESHLLNAPHPELRNKQATKDESRYS
jgi:hypothetical protein